MTCSYDALENALLSGMGERGGRALIISTSAPDDAQLFSVWLGRSYSSTVHHDQEGNDPTLAAPGKNVPCRETAPVSHKSHIQDKTRGT